MQLDIFVYPYEYLYNTFFQETTVVCKICGFELLFEKNVSI